jgi:hypothetical protein
MNKEIKGLEPKDYYMIMASLKNIIVPIGLIALISCGNLSISNEVCLHVSEVNIIEGLIWHDGKPFSGVLFEEDHNVNRKEYKIKSPIEIRGLPNIFHGRVGYAMTIVNGQISGPFVTMADPYDVFYFGSHTTEYKEQILGSYFSFDLEKGLPVEGDLRVFNNNGDFICSVQGETIKAFENMEPTEFLFGKYPIRESIYLNSDCTLSTEHCIEECIDLEHLFDVNLLKRIQDARKRSLN